MNARPTPPDPDSLSEPTGVAQPVPERDIDRAAGRTSDANNVNAVPDRHPDEVVPRPADPANRTRSERDDEVHVGDDGEVHQKGHGSMDETMIPQKPEPDAGPWAPAPGHLDDPKDVEPRGKGDLSA